eukprot:scaffold40182_cov67-Phaeocystis_antarctica.AAC.2
MPSTAFFSESFHLGRCCSETGPPTEPNKMASLSAHAWRVDSGKCSPLASNAAPPTGACLKLNDWPKSPPACSSTLTATSMTSGPMPSPGSTATVMGAELMARPRASRSRANCCRRSISVEWIASSTRSLGHLDAAARGLIQGTPRMCELSSRPRPLRTYELSSSLRDHRSAGPRAPDVWP